MPEPKPRDRLQPSLLDRLTDDGRGQSSESRDRRVLTERQLRDCVVRDLAWLLNTRCPSSYLGVENYPAVADSVLNFGFPSLAGTALAGARREDLEERMSRAIRRFEPRIVPDTLKVRADIVPGQMTYRALTFYIEGEVWGDPVPLRMFLKTDLDLQTGEANVTPLEGPAQA